MKLPGDAAAMPARGKTARGNASQFYVAAELCRRGHAAAVTLGNTPGTDVHVQPDDAAPPVARRSRRPERVRLDG